MKKLLSMFLALGMVLTMLPVSLAEGGGRYREIVAFAELQEKEKTVTPGTAFEDIGLPETLTATVLLPRIADSGDTDSGDAYSEYIVSVRVATWASTPEYDIAAEVGTAYLFTPVIEGYTVSAALPEINVTVETPMLRGKASPLLSGTYNIWVGGVQVTDANKGNINGTGITGIIVYDSDTNTLTLNEVSITAAYDLEGVFYGIYARQDLNIVLQGTNTVTAEHSVTECAAVCVPNNTLTIEGDGSLTATGSSEGAIGYGIVADTLTINGDVALTAIGNGGNTSASFGINVGDVTINGGTVVAQGEALGDTSWGMYVNNQAIFNGGTITAKGTLAAIMTANTLDISSYSNVRISASTTDAQGYNAEVISEETLADSVTTYKYLKVEPAVADFEQFTEITPGNTYYFDLSSQIGKVGTVSSALPDTTLHYVPFTYAGTVNAYSLHNRSANPTTDSVTAAGNTTDPNHAIGYKSDRSLFVGDYVVGTSVTWASLNANGLIFGEDFDAHYKLRSLSAGGSRTGTDSDGFDHIGQPESNEWDQVITKSGSTDNETGWIKNWDTIWSWGQDTYAASEYRRVIRGNTSARRWDIWSDSGLGIGFRPALEVLNPDDLGADGLKEVTLNLNGGGINGSAANINIICAGDSFTAPSGEGLTPPFGKVFDGWRDRSTLPATAYSVGARVPNSVTGLTAQWGIPKLLNTTTNKRYASLQTAVDAVANGQTIQLQGSIELLTSVTISNNASFTLDLNAFTLDGVAYTAIIHNGSGTLTVVDSRSNGLLASGARSTITLNGGSLIIQSGNIAKSPSPPFDSYAILNAGSGSVSVLGGFVRANQYGIWNKENGSITIENGTLISVTKSAIQNEKTGKITIKDGASITSAVGGTAGTIQLAGGTAYDTVLEITGGTINNSAVDGHAIYNSASGKISIPSGSPVIKGGGMAMTTAPDLSGFTNVRITASKTAADGSATSVIDKTDIDTNGEVQAYKYLKFETKLDTTVTDFNLTGKLTAPETGGTPEECITEGDQYTGTVAWSDSPAIFRGSTIYTATVILTAKEGYTFSDVTQDAFSYEGATVTNSAGSGNTLTITIVFAQTAARVLQFIAITKAPDKVAYKYGETFSPAGMAVEATYNDGTTDTSFTDYIYDKDGPLKMSDTLVALTAGGTNITTTQAITVDKADQATLGITAVGSKTYGDAPFTLTVTGGTGTGTVTFSVPDDNGVLTVSGSTATIVGAGTVTVTANKAGDSNYNASDTVTQQIIVDKAAQAISIAAVTGKKYGDAPFMLTVNGGSGTGAVTFSVPDDNSVLTLSGSTATIIGAGSVTVTANKAESANHNGVTAASVITIGKAAVPAITFPIAAGITYGQMLSESALTGGSTEFGSFAWTNGSTIPTVSNSGYEVTFTPSGATVANYEAVATTTGIVAITVGKAAAPTITFPTATGITYGQTLCESTLTGGSTEFGSFAWTNGSTVPTVLNSGYAVTFTPSAHTAENYQEIANHTAMVATSVVKADTAVTINAVVSGNAGGRIATITATVTGVAGGETPTGSVKFVDSTGATDADIAGATAVTILNGQAIYMWTGLADQAYKVKAVYGGSNNYNAATSEEHHMDTRKQTQAELVIGDIGTKTYGDSTFTLSATGGSGTGAITFESADSDVVSISGTTATILRAGTVTITATKAEDDSFNEKSATIPLTVNQKALTLKADDKSMTKGNGLPAFTYTVTGLANGDTVTTAPTMVATADGTTAGTFDIAITGGVVANAASYNITYIKGTLTVAERLYAVTVTNGTGSGSYARGTTVTITANDRSGFTFIGWSGDDVVFADNTAVTTTFTMPEKAVTVTANYRQNSSDDGVGSDGGSNAVSTPATYHSPNVDNRTGAVLQQVITAEAAAVLGQTNNTAVIHTLNAQSIDPATLQALAQAGRDVVLHADTMLGNAIQGRLYVKPVKLVNAQQPLKLGVYTEPAKTSATTNLFENHFSNKVVTVSMAQQGSLGAWLEVAAKPDLSELDVKTLYFYAYDKAANLYTQIWHPAYWTDVNGYLHFYTRLGGDIIITDRPLEAK